MRTDSVSGRPSPCHSASPGSAAPSTGNMSAYGASIAVSGPPAKPSASESAPSSDRRGQEAGRDPARVAAADAGLGGEGAPQEPGGVGDGERRAEDHADQHDPAAEALEPGAVAVAGYAEQGAEHALLGHEPGQRRQRRPSMRPRAIAAPASTGAERPTPESRRRSRVPVWWSTIPTTMNRVALNSACATSIARPASAAARVPTLSDDHEETELADRAVGEQQLQVELPQRPPARRAASCPDPNEQQQPAPARRPRRTPGRAAPPGRPRPSPSQPRAGRR